MVSIDNTTTLGIFVAFFLFQHGFRVLLKLTRQITPLDNYHQPNFQSAKHTHCLLPFLQLGWMTSTCNKQGIFSLHKVTYIYQWSFIISKPYSRKSQLRSNWNNNSLSIDRLWPFRNFIFDLILFAYALVYQHGPQIVSLSLE